MYCKQLCIGPNYVLGPHFVLGPIIYRPIEMRQKAARLVQSIASSLGYMLQYRLHRFLEKAFV